MHRKIISVFIMYLLFGSILFKSVQATEIAGIKLVDSVQLEGEAKALMLNGAGVREKFFFDIYVGALYLPSKSQSVSEILAMAGPKRVSMHFLYKEVEKEKLITSWNEGFENNQPADALAKFNDRLTIFNAMFETVHAGDAILLDYIPGTGTSVTINAIRKGVIPGKDFNQALLAVWLGSKPADDDLKQGMLGL